MKIEVVEQKEPPPDRLRIGTRRSIWGRIRLQFSVALLFAVLIPWGIHRLVWGERALEDALVNSLIGTIVALVLGYYSFRRFSNYPGARSSRSILPSCLASYGAVLAIVFFARLE